MDDVMQFSLQRIDSRRRTCREVIAVSLYKNEDTASVLMAYITAQCERKDRKWEITRLVKALKINASNNSSS